MVKPLGHIKRILRLISNVKSKVSHSWYTPHLLNSGSLQESGSDIASSTPPSTSLLSAKGSVAAGSRVVSDPETPSSLSCRTGGSTDSSSLSITPTFKDGVPVNYSLPKCFSACMMESLENKRMPPNIRSAFVRELVVHM